MEDKTDIFGEFGIWVWGKSIPSDVDKCQEFMRMSPLGKYIEKLEKENKDLKKNIPEICNCEPHFEMPQEIRCSRCHKILPQAQPKHLSKDKIEKLIELASGQTDLPSGYAKIINDNFWKLVAQSNPTERSR